MRQKIGSQRKEEILKTYPDAEFVPQASKKRYFYFLGNRKEKQYYKSKIAEFIKTLMNRRGWYAKVTKPGKIIERDQFILI